MDFYNESIPVPQSPERPPLAPYDPPDPAPQAAAWRRALKVVTGEMPGRGSGVAKTRIAGNWLRSDLKC